jgi:hypothetical protein
MRDVRARSRALGVLATELSREASERLYLVNGRRNAGAVKMFYRESRGSVSLSGFLFARPSWLSGLARIFDIGGTFDEYNYGTTPAQTDWLALTCDAEMVRRDFWVAVSRFTEENRSAFLKRKAEVSGATGSGLPEADEVVDCVHGMTLEERREYIKARLRAYHEKKKVAAERQKIFKERYLICAQRNRIRAEAVEKTLA